MFKAPRIYDTEDYRHVDPQFGGDGALLRLRHNTQQLGNAAGAALASTTVAIAMPGSDRHNCGTGGACHNPESPWRDWYSFSDDGTALDWLGYASLPKLDYQSESLVNEIYRGEDSIVRHWLSAVVDGRLAAGCGACWGSAGRGRYCSTLPG
ncbi:alpha-amylase family glycosyl hydrolase [Escherichia coli]